MPWIETSQTFEWKNNKDTNVVNGSTYNVVANQITDIRNAEASEVDDISDAELEKLLNEESLNLLDEDRAHNINWDIIDANNQSLSNFTEIRTLLSNDITWKVPKLDSILARWEALLNTDEPVSDLELSKLLAEITQEAIHYLKNPQNREALVTVSRGLEQSDPVKYKEFQAFLITQDAEFKTIFENLSYPLSKQETTIVAALPNQPIVGNMSKGFSAKLDADTSVSVLQDGETIRRSLSLWKSELPTEVLEVDITEARKSHELEMQSLWSQQFSLNSIKALITQNKDANFSKIKQMLMSSIPNFDELDLGSFHDIKTLLFAVAVKLAQIKKAIGVAEKDYRKVVSGAVHRTRELYKAIDRKANQTLLRLRNLGLDKWNLEALIREMSAGQLMPDLGVTFSADNLDLENQNFWEPETLTDTFDVFNENLTRFANKGLTGNPEGLDENGNLIGFSLVTARLNPSAQTKTGGEIMHLMESQGIMTEGVFNISQVKDNLRKPIES